MSDKSSADAIEQELARVRADLAATVDALNDRLNPKKRLDRATADLKGSARRARDRARVFVQDLADDKPRLGLVLGAAALAVIGMVLLRRRPEQHVHHRGNPH